MIRGYAPRPELYRVIDARQRETLLEGRGLVLTDRLAAKPYTPLPVLGIPGWWAANQNFSYYEDSLVFRPRRSQRRRVHPSRPCHRPRRWGPRSRPSPPPTSPNPIL